MSKARLSFELLILFVGVPLVLALALPPSALYPVLFLAALVGVVLLHYTEGFQWRSLRGPLHWMPVFWLALITMVFATALTLWLLPDRFLGLPKQAPAMLLVIAVFYPLVLVIPQEIVFRPLFFTRYGGLFATRAQAVLANAFLFSLAHLMYWHWVVLLLTFCGSLVFSWAYLNKNSFPLAVVLHSVAGIIIFASGLGWLFYSGGNVLQSG
jgi:membrane protease YdiL (CAAX protease family)